MSDTFPALSSLCFPELLASWWICDLIVTGYRAPLGASTPSSREYIAVKVIDFKVRSYYIPDNLYHYWYPTPSNLSPIRSDTGGYSQ
ncbi:hypothetical protein K503DRAFT_773864 [Rhizopogon vinicolor AM-OR11-026]|uniref:Uncharacterized protein n=1 Tax=Rhizopogon vinicolor AM-OR11-026 TaxID=1314800 RepID=A0A1B7MR50_9AGAM|nr:hypothetical protein K503DRAFT_773864 [Rhizopogon vinicolor AM-OR11-026]